ELLAPAIEAVVVGDPSDDQTQMGPLISRSQLERVRAYVPGGAEAIRGSAPEGPGFWFPPTVLTGTAPDAPVATEEVFGPVAVVLPFDDEQDAVRLANATPYGLSGSIWTRDVGRALRVSQAVRAGNLSVNSHSSVRYSTPFGGYKQSGLGRELGPDALTAFTETKNIFISTEA
ncbi:aldehyde dehydrogenase family protein, partial [Streptomyces chryseus]